MAFDRGGDGRGKCIAIDGQRAAGWQLVLIAAAHDERTRAPHFLMQQTDGVVLGVVRTERI